LDGMGGFEKVCIEKHKAIDQELARQNLWLGDHEKKIDHLSLSDAHNTTQIGNLAKQLGGLIKALWGLAGAIIILVIGQLIDKL